MAVAFVHRVAAGIPTSASSQITVTLTVATTAGNTLILAVKGSSGGAVTAVTDSRGNAWTVDEVSTNTTLARASVASAPMTTALVVGDTITVSVSVDAVAYGVAVYEYAGLLTSPARVDQVNQANAGTGTAVSTAVTTSPQATDLVFSVLALGNGTAALVPPTGFTLCESSETAASGYVEAAENVTASTGTYTANWSWTTSQANAAVIVGYRAAQASRTAPFVLTGQPGVAADFLQSGVVPIVGGGGGGLTAVGASVGLTWASTATTGLIRQLLWTTITTVGASPQFLWRDTAAIGGQGQLLWGSRAVVASLSTAQWLVLTRTSAQRQLLWTDTTSIANARTLAWADRASAGSGASLVWSLGGTVGVANQLLWNASAVAGRLCVVVWNAAVPVTQVRALRWNLFALAATDTALRWTIGLSLVTVGETLGLEWLVTSLSGEEISLVWGAWPYSPIPSRTMSVTRTVGSQNRRVMSRGPIRSFQRF